MNFHWNEKKKKKFNTKWILKAAAVAARLAQSIGNIVNEEIKLPEKIAGFINGRCGNDDELQNIQSASGCKIMLSRDSGKKKKKN